MLTDTAGDGWSAWARSIDSGHGGRWSTLAAELDLEQWTPASEEVVVGD